jgi:hypothetical protein
MAGAVVEQSHAPESKKFIAFVGGEPFFKKEVLALAN